MSVGWICAKKSCSFVSQHPEKLQNACFAHVWWLDTRTCCWYVFVLILLTWWISMTFPKLLRGFHPCTHPRSNVIPLALLEFGSLLLLSLNAMHHVCISMLRTRVKPQLRDWHPKWMEPVYRCLAHTSSTCHGSQKQHYNSSKSILAKPCSAVWAFNHLTASESTSTSWNNPHNIQHTIHIMMTNRWRNQTLCK